MQQIDYSPFSGKFDLVNQAIQSKREALSSSYLKTSQALVAWAFRLTYAEIAEMDPDTFFDRLAAAEYILGTKHEPADPKIIQKKQEQKQTKGSVAERRARGERVSKKDLEAEIYEKRRQRAEEGPDQTQTTWRK